MYDLHAWWWFLLGDLDIYDFYLNTIAFKLNIVVISIDYRLSPEHKHPAAIEDCWTVVKYYIQNSEQFNSDLKRTILAGDSAGGNLVSVITHRLIENGYNDIPKFVVFITPFLQLFNLELPSLNRYFPRGFISYFSFYTGKLVYWYLGITNPSKEMNELFINNTHTLAIDDDSLRDKYNELININLIPDCYKQGRDYYKTPVFPQRADEPNLFKKDPKFKNMIKCLFEKEMSTSVVDDLVLKKFPQKAYFIIYECDQLKDDGLIFAQRLQTAGVDVKVIVLNYIFMLSLKFEIKVLQVCFSQIFF